MKQRKIKSWFTRNGIHIPIYEEDPMSSKVKQTLSKQSLPPLAVKKNPNVFSSIESLEKKAVRMDLTDKQIESAYKQAQKHYENIQTKLRTAHPLEDTEKLKDASYRLKKIMENLKTRWNED